MSAKDQISAMLDELMGTSRNGEQSNRSVKFDDYRVCRAFLLGCCPYIILSATRADIGSCNKMHDLALKADYEKAILNRKDYNFEYDALTFLENFIAESERRKEIAKRRLKESQDEIGEEIARKTSKVAEIDVEMTAKLKETEEYGAKGDVDNSMRAMEEVEELRKKKQELENSISSSTYQQQKLRICDICSAHLGIHDNDRRLVDHFGGKLHLGFIFIREKLEELKTKVQELREQRRTARDGDKGTNSRLNKITSSKPISKKTSSENKDSSRSTSATSSRSRSRSRSRTRSRSRDSRSKKSSRSRSDYSHSDRKYRGYSDKHRKDYSRSERSHRRRSRS